MTSKLRTKDTLLYTIKMTRSYRIMRPGLGFTFSGVKQTFYFGSIRTDWHKNFPVVIPHWQPYKRPITHRQRISLSVPLDTLTCLITTLNKLRGLDIRNSLTNLLLQKRHFLTLFISILSFSFSFYYTNFHDSKSQRPRQS